LGRVAVRKSEEGSGERRKRCLESHAREQQGPNGAKGRKKKRSGGKPEARDRRDGVAALYKKLLFVRKLEGKGRMIGCHKGKAPSKKAADHTGHLRDAL